MLYTPEVARRIRMNYARYDWAKGFVDWGLGAVSPRWMMKPYGSLRLHKMLGVLGARGLGILAVLDAAPRGAISPSTPS